MYSLLVSVYTSMIESVVFCPCFGRKRGLKLKSQDQEDDVIDDVTVESPQYSPG